MFTEVEALPCVKLTSSFSSSMYFNVKSCTSKSSLIWMKKKINTSIGQIEFLRHHWQSIGFLTLEPSEFRECNHSLAIQGHPKMKKSLSQIAELWRPILLPLWSCQSSEYPTTIFNLELCFHRAKKRVKTLSIYLLTNPGNPQFSNFLAPKQKWRHEIFKIRYVTSSIFGNSWDPDEAYSTQTLFDQEPLLYWKGLIQVKGRAHMEATGNGFLLWYMRLNIHKQSERENYSQRKRTKAIIW